ncbi:MAG: hydantoinase/oxoprolinase family protein [Actinobacteria bacterium]|jgi:N-methylhydantoinase A/acetophenone carboxylase|nr:MAG: hydantoinase/oxoprolinase family protein [Actinomycetota bacterium]
MAYTIDIDTGGTFTDGYMTRDAETVCVKVLTTPHDLTQCIMDCIEEGADAFGLAVPDMLKDTEVIRYSTTVGTNTILQRNGPQLGLILSEGSQENIYREEAGKSETNGYCDIGWLIPPDMVRGIDEATDSEGEVLREPDRTEVLAVVEELIDIGARIIVVSLINSYANRRNEQAVREIIRSEFPRQYLGAIPTMLASDVSSKPGDYVRTCTALLNAYIHPQVARYLNRAEEDIRGRGYERPLLIVHSSGGVSRVAKTIGLHTFNSGPVAGLVGAAFMAGLKGSERMLAVDIGGTSADMGIILDGEVGKNDEPMVQGIPLHVSMIDVLSLGSGGGSIAYLDEATGELKVGPQSAGAFPGPAAFDLGGSDPTVTDADLVLGFVDPDYFLGGRKKLNLSLAETAIREKIAAPLGIGVEEAAYRIVKRMNEDIRTQLAASAADNFAADVSFDLLVYGGAGPTHCCWFGALPTVERMIVPLHAPVFSAFGASRMDLMHLYSVPMRVSVSDAANLVEEDVRSVFRVQIDGIVNRALMDMRGEGFEAASVRWEVSAQLRDSQTGKLIVLTLGSGCLDACGFEQLDLQCIGLACKESGMEEEAVWVERMMLHTTAEAYKPDVPCREGGGYLEDAEKGSRRVFWGDIGQFIDTMVYDRNLLRCGHEISGPVIVEAADTTYVIPSGFAFTIDEYLNAIVGRE